MTYKPPKSAPGDRSHLERLVQALSVEEGIAADRLRRWVSTMILLGALERLDDDEHRFLLKGGVAIELRVKLRRVRPRTSTSSLHLHPYPEVFVVQACTAVFTAGDEELIVDAGHIVVVPAQTPHGFKNPADDKLRVVSVHPSPTVSTLTSGRRRRRWPPAER